LLSSLLPKLDDQLLVAGAGAGVGFSQLETVAAMPVGLGAGFGADLFLEDFLADFFADFFADFLAAFFEDFFLEDFFATFFDFLADFFLEDFFAFLDFLTDFFFAAIDFFIFLLFLPFFFFALAILVLHFAPTKFIGVQARPVRALFIDPLNDSGGGPPVAQSSSSTVCTTGMDFPPALELKPICTMHPMLPAATISGVVDAMFAIFRSRNRLAMSGWRMLYVPAEPQHR
jgi:hypothetical protein